MVNFEKGGDIPDETPQNIKRYIRRLKNVSDVTDVTMFKDSGTISIDLYLKAGQNKSSLASSIQLSNQGEVEIAVLRLPTFEVEPDQFHPESHRKAKDEAIRQKYLEIKDEIVRILQRYVDVDYTFDTVQGNDIDIRMQELINYRDDATIHVIFERMIQSRSGEYETRISKGDLANFIEDVTEMWEQQYTGITVDRR